MRRALTLIETAIAAILIGLLLIVATQGMDAVRDDLKRRRTENVLVLLDKALTAYHQTTGRWPVDPDNETQSDDLSEHDRSGDRVIAALATVPEARKALEQIPPAYRAAAPNTDAPASPAGQPWGTVHDAWGQRLRCITADSLLPSERDALAANAGKPIFISAGPDKRFGLQNRPNAADNIRSDGR